MGMTPSTKLQSLSNFRIDSGNPVQAGPRAGILDLPRGTVPTPVFMPVGTQATVKGTLPRDLNEVVRAPIILGNTYHLNLRPGVEVVRQAGGLADFMNWSGPVLTDSGGFQVFSLSKLRKINDEGVRFRSHLDGREIFLGPHEAVAIQDGLRSDIAMCLDVCPAADDSQQEVESAVNRTSLWARACQQAWEEGTGPNEGRNLFGIVQGGRFEEMRRQSAEQLIELNFPGYAVGGVSVGETEEEMLEQVNWTTNVLPASKPRYVMGVGTPPQLLKMIGMGADMFDCVMPSRAARHGMAYTSTGTLNLRNEKFKEDYTPLDETSDCSVSREFSKSYLRHLIQAKESLAGTILTLHNLRFFVLLMEEARKQILAGKFEQWSDSWIARYKSGA
ncbi:tRNA guanosine(34) transglycosylase Tgt [Opitutales bacterium]|jgi:queuine tRNA-ribosyltransferase|nr:tRNA guanosine(34) transglycosylase Tgt [Opitutales bacterium]MDG1174067.1 tRNA guanosine(34) transglycosylase Tgt [Opitutales bacterium]